MSKANRYDEFTIQEQENGPPLVVDRHGRERPSTKVERALWDILNRDDDKARIAVLKARVAELENEARGAALANAALRAELDFYADLDSATG